MQVDFYRTTHATITEQHLWVCRLIAKIYQKKHQIYVHCETEQAAHALDDLLWTFKDDSFIPHAFVGDGPDHPAPILLGYASLQPRSRDILINLANDIPAYHKQFNRILECVTEDPAQKERSREHYRLYREWGYELNTHQVS